jgi:hypothetical protein
MLEQQQSSQLHFLYGVSALAGQEIRAFGDEALKLG